MLHEEAMMRCLTLAEQGRAHVGINPLVGAVLVRDGKVIAEALYRGPGTDHAERSLIKNCDQIIQQEDIIYINLEPCCHTGATPPCTDIIIEKGIKRVAIGMVDPDSRVAGKGIAALRASGVEVIGPVLRAQCERLNRGYISLRTKGRPFITLKKAQTPDGKIAHEDGSRMCITSKEQNAWAHTHLRAKHDAILVGVQTVITDDPMLTARIPSSSSSSSPNPNPRRIILDPDLRIPLGAKVIGARTIVVTKDAGGSGDARGSRGSGDAKERSLIARGVEVLHIPLAGDHFDWDALWKQFSIFNLQFSISSILVEGGPRTWDAFRKARLVDDAVS